MARSDRQELVLRIQTLQSFYYLTQSAIPRNREHIATLLNLVNQLPPARHHELLGKLRQELAQFKKESECLLSDSQLRALFTKMTSAGEGFVYVPKFAIDHSWFRNYARAFDRWPYIPAHALVMFDTSWEHDSPYALWIAEEQLFRDVRTHWENVKRILSDGKDFRTRSPKEHRDLHCYLRTTGAISYHFLEAYVNGLAYDCFQSFHDNLSIEDHDLLAEWSTKDKHSHFVSFERKIRDYPRIVAKYLGREVDLANDSDIDFLTRDGKTLRDSLTHPSPYMNFDTKDPGKVARIVMMRPEQVEQTLRAAVRYVWKVEEALGRDPKLSTQWLQSDFI